MITGAIGWIRNSSSTKSAGRSRERDAGRPAQHRQLAPVHVDLDEADVLQGQFVQRDAADVRRPAVDVPPDQRGHPAVALVAGRQPQPGDPRTVRGGGLDDPHVRRGRRGQQPGQTGHRLDGHHPPCPPGQPSRPRPVPAAHVHGRPAARRAQLGQPGELRLEPRVHGPRGRRDETGGQQGGHSRRPGAGRSGHEVIPGVSGEAPAQRFSRSSVLSSDTCSPEAGSSCGMPSTIG